QCIDAYQALLKGDLTANPPDVRSTDDRLKVILHPTITLRVDKPETGERLSPAASLQAVLNGGWQNVSSYMLVEGLSLTRVQVLYEDATRDEEAGAQAFDSPIPTSSPVEPEIGIAANGITVANTFPTWNANVAALRTVPGGSGARDRGKGTF